MTQDYILYAEDDLDDREAFVSSLKQIRPGLSVVFADSGVHAMELLTTAEILPKYVLIDLNLPLMNGIELLGEIRKHEKLCDLPCMILSTSRTGAEVKKSNDLQVRRYLTKQSNATTFTALLDLNLPL